VDGTVYDPSFIPYVIFLVLSVIGALTACFLLFIEHTFSYQFAKNVAQAGFDPERRDEAAGQERERS
jgi:hypothetical protein